ncbi:alcohol dehydrogenase catalytic domain-containing protein [Dactylosporangium sp. CA-092794]|uniref:alcohol dehydrogenase catalytic domain-containing protein n=1 Tax=Dactylosporangium sp. CA-092794 TaxID=3239929 RepID=UPI003D912F33
MSRRMRGYVMRAFGAPDVMELVDDLPVPEPADGEVLIRVQAIALARTKDVAMRAGRPPFAPRVSLPHTPGTEHAGVIEAVGTNVDPALLGTRVAVSAVLTCGACRACRRGREEACADFRLVGVDRPGCYAEFVTVPAANAFPIPDDLPIAHAAALAANGPVARAQLDAGSVGSGDVVAIMGAAGALGSTAACLAHHRGASVIAVDRVASKAGLLAALPADGIFDGADPELAAKLRAHTGGWGIDCVVDNLGLPDLWLAYRPAVATLGRIVVSGAIGRDAIPMELLPFYLHSQSLIGVRTGNFTQMAGLWSDVSAGFRLPGTVVRTMPWTDMPQAHAMVENGAAIAQTVLEVS